jgi:hypothetical protein
MTGQKNKKSLQYSAEPLPIRFQIPPVLPPAFSASPYRPGGAAVLAWNPSESIVVDPGSDPRTWLAQVRHCIRSRLRKEKQTDQVASARKGLHSKLMALPWSR